MIERCVGAAMLFGLGACVSSEAPRPAPVAAVAPPPAPALTFSGPVLRSDGTCTEPSPSTATEIAPGIGECDLVRLKGKPPTDMLVGAGRSGREVQVLYSEPGAKELYFFVNNRLDRSLKS